MKKQRHVIYTTMLTESCLNEYFNEIDLQAHAMLGDIIHRLAEAAIFEYAFRLGARLTTGVAKKVYKIQNTSPTLLTAQQGCDILSLRLLKLQQVKRGRK